MRSPSPETIPALLAKSFRTHAQSEALRFRAAEGSWTGISYAALEHRVERLARGLIASGIAPGDRVAIICDTRPEWTLCDLALARAGAVSVPLYHVSTPAECEYVVRHSGARMLIAETREHLAIGEEIRRGSATLELLVAIDPELAGDRLTLAALGELGEQAHAAHGPLPLPAPEDLFTIVYTSGTTGAPKGCVHTHATYAAAMRMTAALGAIAASDLCYLYLPLAHVFGREVQTLTLAIGGCLAFFGGDRAQVMDELAHLRPTFFASVPRLYEKACALARAELKRRGQQLSRGELQEALSARLEGLTIAPELEQGPLRTVRDVFGGRLREAWSGAAPLDPEVLEFLFACGVPLYEGYGMTETAAACTLGTRGSVHLGAAGRALPGFEVQTVDREVRLRGPSVFKGYYRDPQASAACFDGDWFCTGDLGALDDEGFLRITGRLKDIVITAAGKNVAPALWENEARRSPYIEEVVVIGDRRPYLAALVVADLAAVRDRSARELIQEVVSQVNRSRPRWARVRRFALLPASLSQECGELTPTGKVRRGAVAERHRGLIEELYASSEPY